MAEENVKKLMNKVSSKGNKKDVFRNMKQASTLQYLDTVLQPLLQHLHAGVSLGVSKSNVIKKFVPFVLAFSVDSAEGYTICGTRPGKLKCRMCESVTSDFNPRINVPLRKSELYSMFQQRGYRCIYATYMLLICCLYATYLLFMFMQCLV